MLRARRLRNTLAHASAPGRRSPNFTGGGGRVGVRRAQRRSLLRVRHRDPGFRFVVHARGASSSMARRQVAPRAVHRESAGSTIDRIAMRPLLQRVVPKDMIGMMSPPPECRKASARLLVTARTNAAMCWLLRSPRRRHYGERGSMPRCVQDLAQRLGLAQGITENFERAMKFEPAAHPGFIRRSDGLSDGRRQLSLIAQRHAELPRSFRVHFSWPARSLHHWPLATEMSPFASAQASQARSHRQARSGDHLRTCSSRA